MPRIGKVVASLFGAAILLGCTIGVESASVSAHTGFESSSPADGEVVDAPVSTVAIVFTGEANPVGEQFVALDATGTIRTPSSITTDDQLTFLVGFDPPLAGGVIGVRWNVQAADAHPIAGSFSFTVDAPVPTGAPVPTTAAVVTTVPPVSTAPPSTTPPASVPVDSEPPATSVSEAAPATTAPDTTTPVIAQSGVDGAEAVTLDEFLAVDDTQPGDGRQLVGRLVSLIAIALTLGGIAFLALTFVGSPREISGFVLAGRITAGLIAVGALIEYLGLNAALQTSFADAWRSTPGSSMALRLVGGLVIAGGLRAAIVGRDGESTRSLSAAVVEGDARSGSVGSLPRARWDVRSSWIAFVGAALVVVSFWFDGHTMTKGWRPLHALVNSVHVVAGSVWVGGVVSMAVIAWYRRRLGEPSRLAALVVRFSSVASVSLAAVVAAGLAMAIMVLDGFGEVTGTEWGRLLLLKSAAVAFAIGCGAYNHFRVKPALEATPDDAAMRGELRAVLTAEAMLLVFVLIVTAWLVAAAS